VCGVVLLFLCALLFGVLVYLDSPSGRRLAAAEMTSVLAPLFKGTITFEQVGGLHASGMEGLNATITAPDGTDVIVARGVRARIAPLGLLRSVLFAKGEMGVDVFDVSVDSAEVNLDEGAIGALKIQEAFEPRTVTPTSPSSGRGVRLSLSSIDVKHVWVHGRSKSFPPIDGDADGVHGSLLIRPERTEIDVSRLALTSRGMPEGANPRGDMAAHIELPSQTGHDFGLVASFAGDIGGLPATARASLDGVRLDAVLDVPESDAAKVRALVAGAPIYDAVALHAEAHGDLSKLGMAAHATLGHGQIDVEGNLSLSGTLGGAMRIIADDIDLRSFAPTAPRSNLGATVDLSLDTRPDGLLGGTFDIGVERGMIAKQMVPRAALRGEYHQEGGSETVATGLIVHAQGTVAEPGAPTELTLDLITHGRRSAVAFGLKTQIPQLSAVKRVGSLGTGQGDIRATGTVDLGGAASFDASLNASIEGFANGPIRLARGELAVHANGLIGEPAFAAIFDGQGLEVSGYQFSRGHMTAMGRPSGQDITVSLSGVNAPNVEANAYVAVGAATTVRDARLSLSRGSVALRARVDSVRVASGRLDVQGALIEGVGEPTHATIHQTPGALAVEAESKGVDLKEVGYLLGVENQMKSGRLAFAIDLTARGNGAEGTAEVGLERGSFAGLPDASMHLDAKMSGRRIGGALHVALGSVGQLDIANSHVEIGGDRPLALDSWRRAWGSVNLVARANLAQLAELFPAGTFPIADPSGQLVVEGHIRRDNEADDTPAIDIEARTMALAFGARARPDQSAGRVSIVTDRWESSGIDVQLDVKVDGDTGFAEVATRLVDRDGAILALDAKSEAIPYRQLWTSTDGAWETMAKVPFSALVVVPHRKLDHLPLLIRPDGVSGEAEAALSVQGTVLEPVIDFSAKARSVKSNALPLTVRLDADLGARYDGKAGDLTLAMRSPKGEVLKASAHVNASVADAILHPGEELGWDLSAHADLSRFPLGAVTFLSDRQVTGHASGDVTLTDWHKRATGNATIRILDLQVGTAKFTSGLIAAAIGDKALDASAHVEQADGSADAKATVSTTWGSHLAPSLDATGAAVVSLQAKHLRAAFLMPFLQSFMSDLDGNVDADARISLEAGHKPDMQGRVALSNANFQLSSAGGEFHSVNAELVMSSDGVVRLKDAVARGVTGKVSASAAARLDGLRLVGANAVVRVAKGEAIPLDVQGTNLGTVYGDVDLSATPSADQKIVLLAVNVPVMHVELPLSSSHAVTALDEPKSAHVGVYRDRYHFAALSIDGEDVNETLAPLEPNTELDVSVHLGKDVDLRRGTQVKIALDGNPTVKVRDRTLVSGQIRLKSGKLDVQGKSFEIEKGTVTFLGDDPSNPEVAVTASWTASDGTRVYADFNGPLKTGKVTLRSEPARAKNEIVALILFGTVDGSSATPYASPQADGTTRAGTTAGSFATAGLSQGLDQLTGMEVTAKIDTSNAANPRPEVEVQIAKNISLQLAVVLGTPPPGTNPDTTYATFDWRFIRNWSLETTFGNLGSSIADVVWQYRY
jgi:translocation and assembly module TamB